ncbi:MAG: response regulator transcription factor [Bryobacteraceae bacterium]
MIRVLVASRSAELEQTIRSSSSLVFAGSVDPYHSNELAADVLVIEVADAAEHDWRMLAELPIPVLLLLDSADSAQIASALRAGIRGVISWDATPQEMEGALHAINAGLVVTMPDAQQLPEDLTEPLSARELDVLDRLAEGLSNKLIAHALSISEHTVKTHVASIFAKLGASSRTEAVSQAIRRGLVML